MHDLERWRQAAAKFDLWRLKQVFKAKVWSHMHVKHSYAEW